MTKLILAFRNYVRRLRVSATECMCSLRTYLKNNPEGSPKQHEVTVPHKVRTNISYMTQTNISLLQWITKRSSTLR